MATAIGSDAAWTLPAEPSAAGQLRRRVAAYVAAAGASPALAMDVKLAVSELVTNVVIHAYAGRATGPVSVACRRADGAFVVEVADEGAGMTVRHDSPGAGQGLAIVGAVATTLDIASRADGPGTVVTVTFAGAADVAPGTGLEPLCALALEHVADVSCVDVVGDGVLRRVAAEVAGDAELTAWLREALPPAKPGTATWAALREGGARLVVHDPAVPRAPQGTGERLGLRWWLAVTVEDPDGAPVALWGLGGREGGRPVPGDEVVALLGEAGRTGLAQDGAQAALRARLS